MARGGGTGSRNKKKKATEASTQNGVDTNQKVPSDSAGDKNKNIKHRKQKEETPPVVPQQVEEDQPQKESQNKLVPTSEQLRLAQITQSADTNKDPQRKAKINQIMEITGKSEDEVATALFDCNWDETKAIELLLEEGGGLGGWEETGKKKAKKSDKDEASRENEDFNDDFDPTNQSDNRERSRNRGPPRLRNRGGSSVHAGRGDSDWKMRENQENERNFEGGRGRGGRGLGPRSRGGGHVGLAPRQRGRGGPRGAGGPRADFAERGGGAGVDLGQIDTWNPIGSEKQEKQDQRLRHNKDAFENAGNWGDDFPDTKVFTPSGSSAKAVGEPVNGSVGHPAPGGPGAGSVAPANNSLSYSQPIDLSSLLKTGGLGQYNAAASQDLKSAIGIGGGKSAGDYSGGPSLSYSSGSSPYNTAGSSVQLSSVPGSAFSPIKPAAVTNGSGDRGKALPRARLPPPSRIPSSAVEMPGAGQDAGLSNLDVQFGGMDLQFGAGSGGGEAVSGLDFNAAPGQAAPVKDSHGLDSNKYGHSGHSITSSVGDRKAEDSYKAASLAPGSVKEVNQSLSSALSAAGIKPSGGGADSVPGYVRQPGDKFGPGAGSSQRSPGPMITKSDTLGYNSQAYYQGDRQSGSGKSNYNSYGGQGYERQSSSGYSGSNGLNSSSYPQGSGSYNSGQNNSSYSSSGYNSNQTNNFSSSGNSYSSFSSSGNSYSSKSGGSASTTSGYLPSATTGSGFESSATTTSSSKSSYDTTATVSAGSSTGLGLSSVSSSSKMSVNSSSGNKLVPGMPPGVANVLPAQYMIGANTPAGFPAYLAAGLGQPAAAMYGYSGHQLEDLAALQRSTLAATLPQLVSNTGHQHTNTKGPSSGYYDPSTQFGGSGAVPSTLASRQADTAGSTFGGGDTSKFAGAGGVSDSTSSPVPSTVGNTVGQPTPFNLASTFTAAQHPTLPPGYAYFYGGVGGMPGLQYGGGVAGGGVYPPTHPGIPTVPTAAGQTSTTQFQNKAAYGSSYGTSYDSLSLGQSSSGYVNKNYGSDNNQAKTGSSNNTAGTAGYWSSALW